MLVSVILLLLGLVILSVSSDMLIESVIRLAKKLKISKLIISLTLVALGTSIPETVVSLISALKGSNIAFSNVVGSNIANIALILGVSLIIGNITLNKEMKLEINKMMLVKLLLLVLCIITGFCLNKIAGIVMVFCLGGYVFSLYRISKNQGNVEEEVEESEEEISKIGSVLFKNEWILIIVYVICGFLGLIGGGELVVENAIKIAQTLNINEGIIGATIVAIGTSLPELMTSISAMKKKHYDIVIGNIVGSNIINILLILGISSILVEIKIETFEILSVLMMLFVSFVFYIMAKKKENLTKINGIILLVLYLASTILLTKI